MTNALVVTPDNFIRAETDRMFAGLARGGVGRWTHHSEPTPLDQQTVIRMNRDTLYSFAVVDLAEGAVLTIPEHGDRYLSVMVVNNDHFVVAILHDAGDYRLTAEECGTRYVALVTRVLVDPADPGDIAAANAVQQALDVSAGSSEPFAVPDYEEESFAALREELLERSRSVPDTKRMFGRPGEVDPERHLLGTAFGWGGLPESEAMYLNVEPGLPVGRYRIVVPDVPVDGFWSISLYNAQGFFELNDRGAYSVNSITGQRGEDGTITVHLGGCEDGRPNCLPIMEGWNYVVRMYRPRQEIGDGTWTFPAVEALD